ncbi:MAG: SH3 domain-containing protein [Acidobacteriota bacterium]|nr:SH3 domain-containing protein [Acidobacteriota bacterium]
MAKLLPGTIEFQMFETAIKRLSSVFLFLSLPVLLSVVLLSGCATFAQREDSGVIIARRAQVRSSTALVAADLSEVTRGDVVDILEAIDTENGERWLHVRLRDTEGTEGWIEERNVLLADILDRSRKLAEEDKDIPPQATGQLRANTNLRFSPDRTGTDNILLKLESGTNFEIVGWKRVPKAKSSDAPENDDTPKEGTAIQKTERSKGDGALKEAEETTELWYKVRLRPSESPAPGGWIYGKQVELTVPSDIIFYRTGREFVAWQRLDDADSPKQSAPEGKDAAVETQPGNWVILEKSATGDSSKLNATEFDRVFVLGYDKSRQEHYTAYRSPDIAGHLPLRLESSGENHLFTIKAEDGGQLKDVRFKAYRDSRGILRVEPLEPLPKIR